MEHPYILPYIEQRMSEMGFEKYHYETIRVENLPWGVYSFLPYTDMELATDNRYSQYVKEIDASNQFYFLVEKVVNPDLKITSDTGYLLPSEALNYSNFTFHSFKEFTGQIFITSSSAFSLEFVRVAPYDK